MSILGKISEKKYIKLKNKYPQAERSYVIYKANNMDFHKANRTKSWHLFNKLIKAEKNNEDVTKVPFPKGAYNPYDRKTCATGAKINHDSDCTAIPDNQLLPRKAPEELVEELCEYDIISFDVFDTLIFRPCAQPTDIFYLLESEYDIINFKECRLVAEHFARQKTLKPNFEVDIYDIYEEMSTRCLVKKEDAEKEIALEKQICYANPYMLKVFDLLKDRKKKMVATSDMYLPSRVIKEILNKNGFSGFDNIFVSCEHGHCKGTGKLFGIMKSHYSATDKIVHLGDNEMADVKGAQKAGIDSVYYEQCNGFGNKLRPGYYYSPVASMYKGVVNNYVYNGTDTNTAREDFGFIYGGPIVSGYCEFVNEFVKNNNLDKIFFLARDMDIFYKMYEKHYKKYDTEYVVTSRFSLQECLYGDFTDECLFHTINSRMNRGYTIEKAFEEIDFTFLLDKCLKYGLNPQSFITDANLDKIKDFIRDNIGEVVDHFKDNEEAAKQYFKEKLGEARRVCIVDLGWRGSITADLHYLLVKKWKLCDEIKGTLFGSTESDTSINLISHGIITNYAYNHILNREFVRQDKAIHFTTVVAMESLFTSTENSLVEYKLNKETGKVEFLTYKENPNKKIIREFHKGIEQFVDEFERHRKPFRHEYPISAVDAFEPMNLIMNCGDYIARVIGDVLDTPFQVAGLNIDIMNYVPIGQVMLEQGLINKWPID